MKIKINGRDVEARKLRDREIAQTGDVYSDGTLVGCVGFSVKQIGFSIYRPIRHGREGKAEGVKPGKAWARMDAVTRQFIEPLEICLGKPKAVRGSLTYFAPVSITPLKAAGKRGRKKGT